ncbi:MAG: response regulator [Phycisphaeraceae bacterium]|nr:response regulator [Phycisphaeraceae bacterium]
MKRVLVVDDMPIYREPIEAVLRANGFTVITASNGHEALAAISNHRPDLVLLDLGMPVMDGLSTLRRIRDDPVSRLTTVIILSAESDRARVVDAMKLGIAGYLLKSQFSLKEMLERVHKAMDEHAMTGATGDHAAQASQVTTGTPSPLATKITDDARTADPLPGTVARPPSSVQPVSAHTPGSSKPSARASGPLMTRSELLKAIQADKELSGFSPTVSQVLSITASDNCSMEQVAKAVSQDHTIALKILRLANSAVYSRGDRVDTVPKAVMRIGIESIRQAVLNIGVVERFGSLAFERHLSTPLFWEHSIACGLIGAMLAHALKHREPDAAFTAGLLHDLGRVIFAERLGEMYVQVLESARATGVPLERAESLMLQLNHADAMDRVLQAWRFPKDLVTPIVLHHMPPDDVKSRAPQQQVEVLRLILADRMAHAMMLGGSGNDTISPTEDLCRSLGVESATIRQIEATAKQQTDDTKFALLSNSHAAAWPRVVEQYRAALIGPFRPLYVSALPELDAYRIFCTELAGPSLDDAPPTIAVVHLASPKEREEVSRLLATAEHEAGVQRLPMVLFSPSGKLRLHDQTMAERPCRCLSTPTPVVQIISAANDLLASAFEQAA